MSTDDTIFAHTFATLMRTGLDPTAAAAAAYAAARASGTGNSGTTHSTPQPHMDTPQSHAITERREYPLFQSAASSGSRSTASTLSRTASTAAVSATTGLTAAPQDFYRKAPPEDEALAFLKAYDNSPPKCATPARPERNHSGESSSSSGSSSGNSSGSKKSKKIRASKLPPKRNRDDCQQQFALLAQQGFERFRNVKERIRNRKGGKVGREIALEANWENMRNQQDCQDYWNFDIPWNTGANAVRAQTHNDGQCTLFSLHCVERVVFICMCMCVWVFRNVCMR
jgi:hypothetical protein